MLTAAAPAEPVDLSTCAQEPIHIPGRIQPHGLLFVLEDPSLVVLQASVLSSLDYWVEPFELDPRISGSELPVDALAGCIALLLPGLCLVP